VTAELAASTESTFTPVRKETPVSACDSAADRISAPEADLELVVRAKQGDTEAFSCLVSKHQHLVYNLAYRFMRDSVSAEDMAQEAFLKAFRMLGGFRGDCSFSTWLYRVAASVCLTEINRRKRRNEVEFQPGHEGAVAAAAHEMADMPELMRRCVRRLPARYARIMTMYYLNETPYEEIAQRLKVPMGTLKTWMHRARKQLKKIVTKELCGHDPA